MARFPWVSEAAFDVKRSKKPSKGGGKKKKTWIRQKEECVCQEASPAIGCFKLLQGERGGKKKKKSG